MNSRITGPCPLPPAVTSALTRPMQSHRSNDFKDVVHRVKQGLMPLLGVKKAPLMFTSSGTAALESTLLNLVSRSDRILALSIGYYGDLYAQMAVRLFARQVKIVRKPVGESFDAQSIHKLFSNNQFDTVLITHNESSTGTLQPLAEICTAIRQNNCNAKILVDAVSSIGCTEFKLDEWQIDAAVTVTQKGLMSPPGLSIVAVSDRALATANGSQTIGTVAFDYQKCDRLLKDNLVITTPSLHSYWGLDAALKLIQHEGINRVYERHKELAALSAQLGQSIGLEMLPCNVRHYSNSVSAMYLPSGLDSNKIMSIMEQDHKITIGQGVGNLKTSVIRIGHMGWVRKEDIEQCFSAISSILGKGIHA